MNFIEESISFFSFQNYHVRIVVLSIVLLTISASMIGCFTFLKKQALIGDTVSHSVLPGIVIGFILAQGKGEVGILLGAFISGWLSVLLTEYLKKKSKLKYDSIIGVVLSLFFGLGIVLLTYVQQKGFENQAGLDQFLFGKAAGAGEKDVLIISVVSVFIVSIILLFREIFSAIVFNKDYATSIGLPVKIFELILSIMTVLIISVGVKMVGVVLMAALLITPASAARFWTKRLSMMILYACLIGVFSGVVGVWVSFLYPSSPTGPWVVVTMSSVALFSFLFSPKKGIVNKVLAHQKNRVKIISENLLKVVYHYNESKQTENLEINKDDIQKIRSFSARDLKIGLRVLHKKGMLLLNEDSFYLTEKGWTEAKRIVRLHRLWEMYLSKKMQFSFDHIHNNAETIEHIITPGIEKQLINELGDPDLDPHHKIIPK